MEERTGRGREREEDDVSVGGEERGAARETLTPS